MFRCSILFYLLSFSIFCSAYDSSWAVHYTRGSALLNDGWYNEAVTQFNKALELNKDQSRVFAGRGLCFYHLGRIDEAITDFTSAVKLDPLDCASYNNRGICRIKLDMFDKAIIDFDNVTAINPDDKSAWYNRGFCLMKLMDYSKAIFDLTVALELTPDNHGAYCCRGWCFQETGDFQKAIADYDQALSLKPGDMQTMENRQFCLERLIESGTVASFELDTEGVAPDWFRGRTRLLKDTSHKMPTSSYTGKTAADPPVDDDSFFPGIDDYSETDEFYFSGALQAVNRRQYEQAVFLLSIAIGRMEKNESAYLLRGMIRSLQRRYKTAIQDLTMAMIRMPQDQNPYIELAWIFAGADDRRDRDWSKALELSQKAVSINRNLAALEVLGLSFYRAHCYRKAAEIFWECYQKAEKTTDRNVYLYLLNKMNFLLQGEP
ncbi:MAG: tetratricopeptide repeat protein [Candidatus Wallbacteria bacterium]|nr:tetratricopeptide repeat protein [Candidatus Wallbacteria bacterium]